MVTFNEAWFPEQSQKALARLADVVRNVPGLILEIGAWEGCSTIALANACYPRPLVTCDTWWGSSQEISETIAADRDVFATWQVNVNEATRGNVVALRGDWADSLPLLPGPIALAFIDAEHSYHAVHDNIAALLPKMAPGGIICGDDAHHGPVQEAVKDLLGDDVYVDATLWIWQVPAEAEQIDGDPVLAEKYAAACATPSDIYLHLPRMVDLVRSLNAKNVIELGTRGGVSTFAWLYALERTGGKLWSVDIDPRPDIGEYDHWEFIRGDDCDPAVITQLPTADIVFIDTSHLYGHTVRELVAYASKVRSGGVICLHDTELPIPDGAPPRPVFPVKKAMLEFVRATGWEHINFPDCWGFGVIRAP